VIDLDEFTLAASRLEPMPASIVQLASMVATEHPELARIVEIVQYDQVLTATLLRAANSSWSASRTEITTVRDAVVRLGSGPVLSLALSVTVRGELSKPIPEYGLGANDLWSHSIAASLATEVMTRFTSVRLPAETPTAALLHDIGKLILARFLDAELMREITDAEEHGATRVEAEVEAIRVDHAEVGALVAQAWELPDSLVQGVRLHHAPERTGLPIALGVHLADSIAKSIGVGDDDNAMPDTTHHAMVELGMTPDGFDEVCRLVSERFEEMVGRYT
jgi:putative nucleotidyltransferase with HDIG domain